MQDGSNKENVALSQNVHPGKEQETKKQRINRVDDCAGQSSVQILGHFDEKQIEEKMHKALMEKMQLETYIKSETRAALVKVTGFITAILAAITVAGFLGWNQIVERVSTNAAAKVANDVALSAARDLIHNSVMGMISNSVPRMIDNTVPQMISDTVGQTERQLKEGITEYVSNQLVRLERNEKSIMGLYAETEKKLSLVPIMAEARAGDRASYEKLRKISDDDQRLALFICPAIGEIESQYRSKKFNNYNYNIVLKTPDSTKLDLEDYVEIVNADNDWNCDGAINGLIHTGKKEFVATLVRVVKFSKRLDSIYLAICGIEKLTNKSFSPLAIQDVLRWWETAKETSEYHSPYQAVCDLRREVGNHGMQLTTNKTDFLSFVSRFDELLTRYPDCQANSKLILTIVAYSPFRQDIICADNSIYKRALDALEPTPFGQTDKWYCYKSIYDAFRGGLYEGINARLKVSDSFEEELRKSGLFNNSLFERDDLNWPSRRKQVDNQPNAGKASSSQDIDVPGSLPSSVIGYITVNIQRGKRQLPLPFIRQDGIAKERLISKSNGAKEGDVISWTIDQQIYSYKYTGRHWIAGDGAVADDVEIPAGQCEITYERVKDEESEMSFAGPVRL